MERHKVLLHLSLWFLFVPSLSENFPTWKKHISTKSFPSPLFPGIQNFNPPSCMRLPLHTNGGFVPHLHNFELTPALHLEAPPARTSNESRRKSSTGEGRCRFIGKMVYMGVYYWGYHPKGTTIFPMKYTTIYRLSFWIVCMILTFCA